MERVMSEGEAEIENARKIEERLKSRENAKLATPPPGSQPRASDESILRKLVPGRQVKVFLDDTTFVEVNVYPPSWKHVIKYGDLITRVVELAGREYIAGMKSGTLEAQKEGLTGDAVKRRAEELAGKSVAIKAIPMILNDGFALIEECLRIEPPEFPVEDLPADSIASIVEAWVEESFGDEIRRRPWKAAVEKALAAVARRNSTLETPSNPSSKAGIRSEAS